MSVDQVDQVLTHNFRAWLQKLTVLQVLSLTEELCNELHRRGYKTFDEAFASGRIEQYVETAFGALTVKLHCPDCRETIVAAHGAFAYSLDEHRLICSGSRLAPGRLPESLNGDG